MALIIILAAVGWVASAVWYQLYQGKIAEIEKLSVLLNEKIEVLNSEIKKKEEEMHLVSNKLSQGEKALRAQLAADNSQFSSQVSSLTSKNNELSTLVEKLTVEKRDLETQVAGNVVLTKNLQSDLSVAEEAVAETKKQYQFKLNLELAKHVAAKDTEISKLKDSSSKAEKLSLDLLAKSEKINAEIAVEKSELAAQMEATTAKLSALETQLAELKQELENLTEMNEEKAKGLTESEDKINNLEELLKEKQKEHDALLEDQRKYEDQEKKILALEDLQRALTEKAVEAEDVSSAMFKGLSELSKFIGVELEESPKDSWITVIEDHARSILQQHESQVADLTKEVAAKGSEISKLSETTATLTEQNEALRALSEDFEEVKAQLAGAKEQEEAEKKIAEQSTEDAARTLESKEARIIELSTKLEDVQRQLGVLKDAKFDYEKKDEEISELKAAQEKQAETVGELETKLQAMKLQSVESEEQLLGLQKKHAETQEDAEIYKDLSNKTMISLAQILKEKEDTIADLEKVDESNQTKTQELLDEITQLKAESEALKSASEHESRIRELEHELESAEAASAKREKALGTLREIIEKLKNKVKAAEAEIAGKDEELARLGSATP